MLASNSDSEFTFDPDPDPNLSADPRFYYLHNFQTVLAWIATRYADLLDEYESGFIARFAELSRDSQALLVRMIMRQGLLFRVSKLNYEEIAAPELALRALTEMNWLEAEPALDLEQLFALLTHAELRKHASPIVLPAAQPSLGTKGAWLKALRQNPVINPGSHALKTWAPTLDDPLYALNIRSLCERLRLIFFGNLRQSWSEFVLVELGIYRYETVEFSMDSRGLRTRDDLETYLQLHAWRERFDAVTELGSDAVDELLQLHDDLQHIDTTNEWLKLRHAKCSFRLGQHAERCQHFTAALTIYAQCAYPGARARRIRVHERNQEPQLALELLQHARAAIESEAERQQLARMLPRLQRQLGLPAQRNARLPAAERVDWQLERGEYRVEEAALRHLHSPEAPVYYVENTLINALFGLLCWRAIFASVSGAFFHAYQRGPNDLFSVDFYRHRQNHFEACLLELDNQTYQHSIRRIYRDKYGLQSPFVNWRYLDETLLEHALTCIPATHLRRWFERLLEDIKNNRCGMPDLVQFWPAERRYRMIEIKGPGDRLQDNQLRWLAFCREHGMPVQVAHVTWAEPAHPAHFAECAASGALV